jgi:hypothetical protein
MVGLPHACTAVIIPIVLCHFSPSISLPYTIVIVKSAWWVMRLYESGEGGGTEYLISYVLGLLEFMFCDCLGWTNL